mgnify:CR=1 FL=1
MADTKKVFTHLQDLETANQAWFNKPSMKFDNYRDILPDLRTSADGSGDAYLGKFTNHKAFIERYESLGGNKGIDSIRTKKFKKLIDKPEIQGDTDWNTYFKSFNAKGDEIIEASGGPKLEGTDLFDIVGGGPDANTTPYEIDRTIALPVEFEYQKFNANEGITPKLVADNEPSFAVVDNFAYAGTLTDVDKVDTQQGFQNPSQTVEELSFTPKTGERANLVKLSPIESEITSENFDNLEFWNSVHTTNTLKNKNDIKIEATLDGPKINIETAQSKVGAEITVTSETPDKYEQMMAKFKEEMYPDMFIPSVSSEKVALSAEALSLQELREIETHVVTGPPNAAAVDFIKKEGYFQDENTSFESKLANDSNATVDNTYFPPTDSQGLETYDAVLSPEKIKGFQNYLDRLKIEDERKQNEELERKKQNETISQQTADKNIIRKADDKAAVIARSEQSAKEHDQRVKDNIEKLSAEKRANDIAERTQKLSAANHERDVKERIKRLKSEEDAQKVRDNLNGGDTVTRAAAQQAKRDNSLAEQLARMDEQYELASDASGEQAKQAEIRRIAKLVQASKVAGRFALEDDPFKFSTLAYPRDIGTDLQNGHFMLFYINVQNKTKYSYTGVEEIDGISQYVRVGDIVEKVTEEKFSRFDQKGGTAVADLGTKSKNEAGYIKTTYEYVTGATEEFKNQNLDVAYKKRQVGRGQRGNLIMDGVDLRKHRKPQTGINSFLPTTTRITDSIALYLPANVESNTKAGYQDFATGMAGYLAMGGIDIIDKIKNHDFQGAADTFLDKAGTIGVEMLKKFGLAAVSSFTQSEGVEETFNKAFGQTLNPYLEVAYTSMGVRTFSYTFKFAPKSADETKDVQAIIQAFRFHMAPELKGTNHRYLTLPSTFDIHYMFQSAIKDEIQAKENSFYNKIATCVLTSCDVNYTPDGVKSFGDGAPTQISMTLAFMETEMLTKQKINEGF